MLTYLTHLSQSSGAFAPKSVEEDFGEKFAKLYPSWPMLVATLISLLLVMLILWHFMYKPVKEAIAARQKYIQDNIDQAEQANSSSQQLLAKANEKLQIAHDEAQNVLTRARLQGDKVLERYINKGKREAERIIEEAKTDVRLQKEQLEEQNRAQIASAASMLSRKILAKHANEEIENEIIDQFLEGK